MYLGSFRDQRRFRCRRVPSSPVYMHGDPAEGLPADLSRREREGVACTSTGLSHPVDASPRVRAVRDTAPCIYVYADRARVRVS